LRALDKHVSEVDVLGQERQEKMARLAQAQQNVAAAHARTDTGWQAVGGARVVSQAVAPGEADWPGPGLMMGGMALLGLLVGVALAVWAETRRLTIERIDDVSGRLGIDVLARLDEIPMAQLR
jgi:capsular polysaccharide biosynthesis protein